MNKNSKYILQLIACICVVFIFNFSSLHKVGLSAKVENTKSKSFALNLKTNHFNPPLSYTTIESEIVTELSEDDDSKRKNTQFYITSTKQFNCYSERLSQIKIKSASLIYNLSLKNRKRIPLFILFQHWKGYIV